MACALYYKVIQRLFQVYRRTLYILHKGPEYVHLLASPEGPGTSPAGRLRAQRAHLCRPLPVNWQRVWPRLPGPSELCWARFSPTAACGHRVSWRPSAMLTSCPILTRREECKAHYFFIYSYKNSLTLQKHFLFQIHV